MHLHRSTVQTNNFNIYLDDPFCLQGCKDAFQHTVFTPSVHARIDCMPVSVGFRQCSPLAAVFRNIQYRVDHLEIGDTDISSLDRKVFFNPLVLLKRDFHGFIIPQSGRFVKNLCEQTLASHSDILNYLTYKSGKPMVRESPQVVFQFSFRFQFSR